MKLNKDSKIMKLSANAEGYYSGATAYGELIIPIELYNKHTEKLKDLSCYVYELDGKHSEVECDIEFEELTILDFLKEDNTGYEEYDREIDEDLFFRVCDTLELDENESERLNNFSNQLYSLDKLDQTENIDVILSKDTLIEGIVIPSGTKIQYKKCTRTILDESWHFNFDWEI